VWPAADGLRPHALIAAGRECLPRHVGITLALTTIDPVKITEYSLVFSAVALPLTYFPVLVIANDPDYVGDKTNSWFSNGLGTVYLILTTVAAVAAIPLMLITKAGA
jgi:Mn2+/Fe2+ NRAMP family transporter